MPSHTLISVVLPTYNGAKFLEQAVQSVFDQTHLNWELIIVDSYSEDETPQIIARYAAHDQRVRAIQNPKENGRLPGALNAGFNIARGDYHTWLSDDNVLRPHALTTMAEYLDAHPEIGLVYTDYSDVDRDRKPINLNVVLPPSYLIEKNIVTPSFLYRCEVYKTIGGYRVQYFLAEDYDFWLRARSCCQFHPIHADCQEYRVHGGSLTATYTTGLDKSAEGALLDCLAHNNWMNRNTRARAYVFMSKLARKQSAYQRQRKYWLLALYYSPYLVLRRVVLAAVSKVFGQNMSNKLSRFYLGLKQRFGIESRL
jgi:glycosyltransferase involved in cell wall biosynthesis